MSTCLLKNANVVTSHVSVVCRNLIYLQTFCTFYQHLGADSVYYVIVLLLFPLSDGCGFHCTT